MATIYIDNKPYEVKDGDNLLQSCLSLGFNLPYFCWHPALHSVGACRLCAVKQFRDEKDTAGKIVMSCMTPSANGTRISVEDPEAKAFRKQVVEWLMLNHPHDCPVCDEGGECHLQDMTVMTGHAYRNTRFPKRTFKNQYLGPFLNHEMNRCIECYRCVRYYRDYAGGNDLNVFASRTNVYFGRNEDGVLESEFSGNLAEVCPTGVFTDKTLGRHYTRKWDLRMAPSVCAHCSLGCNTTPGERYGLLRRITNRFNSEVNGYFLCDRGRFGYEFVNSPRRIRQPLLRAARGGPAAPASREAALARIAPALAAGRAIGIGSPRASLEGNFALRALVGADRFFDGSSEDERRLAALCLKVMQEGGVPVATLREAERSDAVLVLGIDPTHAAPRLALALRQAARQKPMRVADKMSIPRWNDAMVREAMHGLKGPLFLATPLKTGLDDAALETFRGAPDDVARLGLAVAHAISSAAPAVAGLAGPTAELAGRIAKELREAERPLVVAGTSAGSEAEILAAANVALALKREGRPVRIVLVLPECNSLGLALLGGRPLSGAPAAVKDGADTLVVLENDLVRRASATWVDALFSSARTVIAIDHLEHGTTARADAVLPAATFAEGDGTFVSNEGRAQRAFQVFVPPEGQQVIESWRWLRDLAAAAGRPEAAPWRDLEEVDVALALAVPALAKVPEAAPGPEFRIVGQKIPREPHRASGRTAQFADKDVSEPKPPDDPDTPLSFTMEGFQGIPPAPVVPFFWSPGWNSIQSLNKFQEEVGGPLKGGPAGVRLIEPSGNGGLPFFEKAPGPFERRPGEFLVLPFDHIFGSEELSAEAPGIAERAPRPFLGLHPDDAKELSAPEGSEVELALPGRRLRLPVRIRPEAPRGTAALPAGLRGLEGIALPAWGSVSSGSAQP